MDKVRIENERDVIERMVRQGAGDIQKVTACLDDLRNRASVISWELMTAQNSIAAENLARQARGLAEALTSLAVQP